MASNGLTGAAATVEYIPPGSASPVKWGHLSSLGKTSGDSRQRRKPFKSNSNRSLKGLHAHHLTKHDHLQDSHQSDQSGSRAMDTASESYEAPADHSTHSLHIGGGADGVTEDEKSSVSGSHVTFATNTSSSNGYGPTTEIRPLFKQGHDEPAVRL